MTTTPHFNVPARDASDADAASVAVVTVEVDASDVEVWQALTDAAIARRWFGDLTPSLSDGATALLDFGDGDFFEIQDIRLKPPHLVQYAWRFLGIGPLDSVTWHIVPHRRGSTVTVVDSEPGRTREATSTLKQGWRDFTRRLARYFLTDEPSRYDWRREFDGLVELPRSMEAAWELLSVPEKQSQWLPFSGSALSEGADVRPSDNHEPRVLRLSGVEWEQNVGVSFQIGCDAWQTATNCRIEIVPHLEETLLNVSHTGWDSISPNDAEQLRQRKRFSSLWIAAMQRARQIPVHATSHLENIARARDA